MATTHAEQQRFLETIGNDNDAEVARKLTLAGYPVSYQAVHKWRHGKARLSPANLNGLCEVYVVNKAWLAHGEGPKKAAGRMQREEAELMGELPENIKQQAFDFIEYRITRPDAALAPDKIAHYMTLLTKLKGNTPDDKGKKQK